MRVQSGNLQPPLSNAFDKSHIPYYNVYFSDTWHMKPTFTLSYGLGWALEMPPVEQEGKNRRCCRQCGEGPVKSRLDAYLANVRKAALAGQDICDNPESRFARRLGNASNGLKYPYNPFYGEFSLVLLLLGILRVTLGFYRGQNIRPR